MTQHTPKVIEMTGASQFPGRKFLTQLVKNPDITEIHIFDERPPKVESTNIIFHRIDLLHEDADQEMAAILIKNRVDTFILCHLYGYPLRNQSIQREQETIGTWHILNAVAEAKIKKLLVKSDAFVYGARPNNPNFIKETAPLKATKWLGWHVKARVDVEKQLSDFAQHYPDCQTVVLRTSPILGPSSDHLIAKYFMTGPVPKILGFDPLLQFTHEDDAVRALMAALKYDGPSEVFNIAGHGVLPLTTAIHLSGRIPISIPSVICQTAFKLGYFTGTWDIPAELLPYFQYICVLDGHKAQRILNFTPEFSSRQALKSTIETYRLSHKGFSRPSSYLGEEGSKKEAPGFAKVMP